MTGVKPDVTCAMPSISDYSLPFSDGFLAVIDRAMQYDINKRFASAEDMLKAIDNIKKQDSRYKKYVLVQLVSWIVAVALVVSGVLLTVNGFNSGVKTRFEQEYSEFVSESNHGETSQAEAAGRKLLNNSDYSSLIRSSETEDSPKRRKLSTGSTARSRGRPPPRCLTPSFVMKTVITTAR